LVDYIYSTLNFYLDYVLPFAAIPENGREIDGLDDKSELAHRVMLVNLLRLLGAVKQKKASRNFAQLKLFSHYLLITAYSAMMVFIRNRRYCLRHSSCDGAWRVGVSILALPALL